MLQKILRHKVFFLKLGLRGIQKTDQPPQDRTPFLVLQLRRILRRMGLEDLFHGHPDILDLFAFIKDVVPELREFVRGNIFVVLRKAKKIGEIAGARTPEQFESEIKTLLTKDESS